MIRFETIEQKEKYNAWSKEDIYEAYILEVQARQQLEEALKRADRQLALIRHNSK